jgi:hypothetical protein
MSLYMSLCHATAHSAVTKTLKSTAKIVGISIISRRHKSYVAWEPKDFAKHAVIKPPRTWATNRLTPSKQFFTGLSKRQQFNDDHTKAGYGQTIKTNYKSVCQVWVHQFLYNLNDSHKKPAFLSLRSSYEWWSYTHDMPWQSLKPTSIMAKAGRSGCGNETFSEAAQTNSLTIPLEVVLKA